MTNAPLPTDDILEALELPRSDPGIGYLQALFARFNERVPFESASKIVRNAAVPRLEEKARTPEIFWSDHSESGRAGTCFARVAAFEALLSELGFVSRLALGRVQADFDHAALRVSLDGREWIADVGFPLPALLSGEAASDRRDRDAAGAPCASCRAPGAAGSRFWEACPRGRGSSRFSTLPCPRVEFLRDVAKTLAARTRSS